MTSFLQQLLVIASFIGVCYAPFHYLDRFASDEAKARLRSFMAANKSRVPIRPLLTMLDAVFGRKHFTWRCFGLSCVMSLVFTLLFLGAANSYLFDISDYVQRRTVAEREIEKKMAEVNPLLIQMTDIMIPVLEKDESEEGKKQLEDMKKRRAELEGMMKTPTWTTEGILLWMLSSIIVSLNFLCDYIALGKTRIIVRRIANSHSKLVIGGYLILDLILAVVIWTISTAIFILLNVDTFLSVSKSEQHLTAVVGIISFSATVATSIWIYTFLLGLAVSSLVRRAWSASLNATSLMMDPYEHPFKVIGFIGAPAATLLIAILFGVIALLQ